MRRWVLQWTLTPAGKAPPGRRGRARRHDLDEVGGEGEDDTIELTTK